MHLKHDYNSRRNFLKKAATGFATGIAVPTFASSVYQPFSDHQDLGLSKGEQADEKYWEMVKQQFAIPADLIMVNSANLCPSPYVVTEAIVNYTRDLEKDVSFQNREKFNQVRQHALEMLADYLGVEKSEIGITRNTSESNNIIVNGLDLSKRDEVIIWDQNHPTNGIAWEQRAKREGFKVRKIQVPENPDSQQALIKPFEEAITNRTRLVAFSHISNVSGIALPAKKICAFAKSKGILTLIDGAQSFGLQQVNLKKIGCDFYSGSAHKWLMGPKETGILYVNKALMDDVWPSVISAGWDEEWETIDEKLCVLGQRDDAAISALVETINFHKNIGFENIEGRVRQLTDYLKKNIHERISGVSFVTPLEKELSAGIVIFQLADKDFREVFQRLYEDFGIASAPTGGIRLSPNIYNTIGDMERIVEALSKI